MRILKINKAEAADPHEAEDGTDFPYVGGGTTFEVTPCGRSSFVEPPEFGGNAEPSQ